MKAVIQSGGKGTRLKPYTMVLPKPLMPVGSKPVLELLLKWLRRNGTRDAYVTTGYLGHLIRTVCGDGRQWDLRIKYTEEPQPLGTIGGLTLLRDDLSSTFLVVNGDVLTDLNINAFAACHHQNGSALTIATTKRSYGLRDYRGRCWTGKPLSGEAHPHPPGKHGRLLHGTGSARLHPCRRSVRIRRPHVLHAGTGLARWHLPAQRSLAGYW